LEARFPAHREAPDRPGERQTARNAMPASVQDQEAVETIAAELKRLRADLDRARAPGISAEVSALRAEFRDAYEIARHANGGALGDELEQLARNAERLDGAAGGRDLGEEVRQLYEEVQRLSRQEAKLEAAASHGSK